MIPSSSLSQAEIRSHRESYAAGSLAVTATLRAWLEGKTEPPSIADLLEFCRIIEAKAKEPAP